MIHALNPPTMRRAKDDVSQLVSRGKGRGRREGVKRALKKGVEGLSREKTCARVDRPCGVNVNLA